MVLGQKADKKTNNVKTRNEPIKLYSPMTSRTFLKTKESVVVIPKSKPLTPNTTGLRTFDLKPMLSSSNGGCMTGENSSYKAKLGKKYD